MKHRFELVVVRHGRTAWNLDGRFQGHTDVPLDETGRAQARALGTMLAGESFDRAVSSDLARARETAALILAGRGLSIEDDARWREMRFGTWEGLTWSEIVERYPAMAERRPTAARWYTPEGGESFDELCVRIGEALRALDESAHDGGRVLVVTHAGPLHALLRVTLGEGEAAALAVKFSPASITRIALGPESARLIELNLTADGAGRGPGGG